MGWDWAGTREAKAGDHVLSATQPALPCPKPPGFADDSHLLEQSEGVSWGLMGQLGDR